MNQTKKLLRAWEDATIDLANHFTLKYFGKDADTYFVAEETGGVLYVNDHFFNISDVVDFLKFNYSKKMMFEYYQYQFDKYQNNDEYIINIKNYKKCKNTLK